MKRKNIGTASTVAEDAIPLAEIFADDLLELGGTGTGREPPVFEAANYSLDFFFTVGLKLVGCVPNCLVVLLWAYIVRRSKR